jgi:hypothetical protein
MTRAPAAKASWVANAPTPARTAKHEDGVSAGNAQGLHDCAPGGQANEGKAGGFSPGHGFRLTHQTVDRDANEFGAGTAMQDILMDVGDDLIARLKLGHPRTDLLDNARQVPSGNDRKPGLHETLAQTGLKCDVGRIEGRGLHPHQYGVLGQFRVRQVAVFEDFRAAEAMIKHPLHRSA